MFYNSKQDQAMTLTKQKKKLNKLTQEVNKQYKTR